MEGIFEYEYVKPGLHVCNLPTGSGKSHAIARLVCNCYPKHFNRIVILCVQNKLVDEMNEAINGFIGKEGSLMKAADKLVVATNVEVLKAALKEGTIEDLIAQMEQNSTSDKERSLCNQMRDWIKPKQDDEQLEESQKQLRRLASAYFRLYAASMGKRTLPLSVVKRRFPSLIEAYPQVAYAEKKIVLTTVDKAVWGIDPIIGERISLLNMGKKHTLFLFDESDQASQSIMRAVIEQEMSRNGGLARMLKGYEGYHQYKKLMEGLGQVSHPYYGDKLMVCARQFETFSQGLWREKLGCPTPPHDIFLGDGESLDNYRSGVFLSGPLTKLNISSRSDSPHALVCYKPGESHLTLVHANEPEQWRQKGYAVCPLVDFMWTARKCVIRAKAMLVGIAEKHHAKENGENVSSIEGELYTLVKRSGMAVSLEIVRDLKDFIVNRKSRPTGTDNERMIDHTIYGQGFQLFTEDLDAADNLHAVSLTCREISTSAEKMVAELVEGEGNTVVLCSATAASRTVARNFDLKYLQQVLGRRMHRLPKDKEAEFGRLLAATYPEEHAIEVEAVETPEWDDDRLPLPEKYQALFHADAVAGGQVGQWYRDLRRELMDRYDQNRKTVAFQLGRWMQFVEAYHWFVTHDEVHSMIYFQNKTGLDPFDMKQTMTISKLIDGSYKTLGEGDNPSVCISKKWDEVQARVLAQLSADKNAKLMLVTSYSSFRAGANLQYAVADGLDYVEGDNWARSDGRKMKDWDALFLQLPTNYASIDTHSDLKGYEQSLYAAIQHFMKLRERGLASTAEVAGWIYKALARENNEFMFSTKRHPSVMPDKAAFVQLMAEQAVGRICRTRCKPRTTHILYDTAMVQYFLPKNRPAMVTPEFNALAQHILARRQQEADDAEALKQSNERSYALKMLRIFRNWALRYTPHSTDNEPEEDNEYMLARAVESQRALQCFKQFILKYPVVAEDFSFENADSAISLFIDKCYGHEQGEVSPHSTRLDVMMKNDLIKQHFLRNGFATDWPADGRRLLPELLASSYAGELGEEAFLAIVLGQGLCAANRIGHFTDREYELADFVITDKEGRKLLAIDVKNYNPEFNHDDRAGDVPTAEKRRMKRERLGCRLITVNIVKLDNPSIDPDEIDGLIDKDGRLIEKAINKLKQIIEKS